jgi:isobutyryl-CoA mutase
MQQLKDKYNELQQQLHYDVKKLLEDWKILQEKYSKDSFTYEVRGKEIKQDLVTLSLSGTKIPKVVLPKL